MKHSKMSLAVEHWTAEIGTSLASILSWLASWFAPVPEAVMTARAIATIFDLSPALSGIVAISLELVGMQVNAYWLDSLDFNEKLETHRERYNAKTYRYPKENTKAACAFVWAFYGITTMIVVATAIYQYDVSGEWITLLACAFPLASAIGTVTMNKRAAFHRRRLAIDAVYETDRTQPATVSVSAEPAQVDAKPARPVAVRRMTCAEWRGICANPNGNRAEIERVAAARGAARAETVNAVLKAHGCKELPATTARDWWKIATEAVKVE